MSSISSQSPPEKIATVHPNDVLVDTSASTSDKRTLHRILWLSYRDRKAVLFDLLEDDAKLRAPYFKDLTEVEESLRSGLLVPTRFQLPWYMHLSDGELEKRDEKRKEKDKSKKTHKAMRDEHWAMLKTFLDPAEEPLIYLPEIRGPRIAEVALANHKTRRVIRTLLYRAYKYGRIPNAMLPHWPECGAPGKEREPKQAKRGRKPKVVTTGHAPEKVGVNVDSDMRRKILLGVDLFCSLDDRVPIAVAFRKTKEKFFTEYRQDVGGVIVPVQMPQHLVPSEPQFRYYADKRLNTVDFIRKRVGERVFQQQMRAITGTARSELLGPGHTFEIDASIADVYLLSRYNPNWVIGRPVIYVVVDTFSRLIVGLYIGLVGPSWEGARYALANTFTDKVSFCARHGITIRAEQWPVYHYPYYLTADRGELLGLAAESALKNMRLDLATPGPYRPDWKGVVESRFRLLNQGTIDWLPGAVYQRMREMRKRQYVLDAVLNIEEFTHVIINEILTQNLHTLRTGLLTKEMIAEGVEPTSQAIWNWGVANLTGPLRTESADLVRAHLLPTEEATITKSGILYKGLLYTCDRAVEEQWFAQARIHDSQRVPIRPEYFTNTIYLAPPFAPEYLPCRLIDPEEKFANRRMEEALDCLEFLRLHETDLSDSMVAGNTAFRADSNSTIQSAVERKKKRGKKAPKTIDADQIREHRKLEKEIERLKESRDAQRTTATVTPLHPKKPSYATHLGDGDSDVLELLRRQQEEHWRDK